MKKFNVSFDDETFTRVEEFVSKNKINRSALLRIAVTTYIDAQEQLPALAKEIDKLRVAVEDMQNFK